MKIDEGYIKFNCIWTKEDFVFTDFDFNTLNSCRARLYKLNLIGVMEGNIGFGNISIRTQASRFIITGSATGGEKELTKEDYALVTQYDFDKNEVVSFGKTKASAESMSHAALYEVSEEINAIIHVHHLELWGKTVFNIPTTDVKVDFGTPQMAYEIMRLYKETDLPGLKILAMGGHEEGIISFGETMDEAYDIILHYYNHYVS